MISVELKWKNGLSAWVRGLERLFKKDGRRWFGGQKAVRKAPETEGEKALYAAMGWDTSDTP